jgi:hypothetical protein
MFCDSENLPLPVDTPQFQFKSGSVRGRVRSLHVILVPHAVQRRELFTTVLPMKWRRLVYRHPGVCCICLFSPSRMLGDICESGVVTLRTSVFSEFLDAALHLPHLSTLYVHPLMGCNWPLFLIICHLCVTVSHINIVRIRSSIIQ